MTKRYATILVLLGGLLGGLVGEGRPTTAAEARADSKPRIAVISAFAPELTALQAETKVERKLAINGVEFTLGKLAGKDVVLFLSGISMVNAAMNAQLVLDRFNVRDIVFSGIAGGVNPALNVGDVVVAKQWGQYLQADFARKVGNGYRLPLGDKKVFDNFEFIFPQPVTVRTAKSPEGETRFWFPVDKKALAVASKVKGKIESKLKRCTAANECLAQAPKFVVGGNGVSGMAFVDNKAFREYTFKTFKANVLDEESAAVATVAYVNAKPFVAFRSLSDLAGGGSGENQLPVFFQLAADNSAAAVVTFLQSW